jgi:hypothetical protein
MPVYINMLVLTQYVSQENPDTIQHVAQADVFHQHSPVMLGSEQYYLNSFNLQEWEKRRGRNDYNK